MSAITPGAVRMRAVARDGGIADTSDLVVETQQSDGSWIPLRYVESASVELSPNALITACLRVHLSELEIVAPPECVTRDVRRVPA